MGQRARHSAEQIVDTLRRAADLAAAGLGLEETAAQLEVSRATLNNWRRAYSGMTEDAVRDAREALRLTGSAKRRATMTGSTHREPYSPRMSFDDRRRQLLDAAARVIGDQGPHMVSIETVAKQAGVSRPVVKKVFATSPEILHASVERETTGARVQLAAVFDAADHTTTAHSVTGAVERFMDAVANCPDRWRAIMQIANSPTATLRPRHDEYAMPFIAEISAFVHAVTPPTQRAANDLDLTARLVHALFWEAGRITLDESDGAPTDHVSDYIAAAVIALPGFTDHHRRRR